MEAEERGCFLTSPRLRGEVGAKRRVRGTLSESRCRDSPSPQPSPREKRGEGALAPRPYLAATAIASLGRFANSECNVVSVELSATPSTRAGRK
jgi:hypothetical protein